MRFIVALVASLAVVSASVHHGAKHTAPSEKELEGMFSSFVKTHNKKYTHDEFFGRFNTYKTNMEKIRIHNLGNSNFSMASNEFADLTWDEFRASKLGFKNIDNSVMRSKNTAVAAALPKPVADSVDWRTKGIVTPVKDQGQCGSCWAFSTTGSVEGAVAQKTGKLVSLSEQQLVDCSTAQGNMGCNGGLMDYGFEFIISNKGITTEAAYPYKATGPNKCQKVTVVGSTIKDYTDVPAGDEDALLAAVAKGPVSIAIEADQESFQFYSGGVMDGDCGENLDHGVLAVGYGTDAGKDYWIVKNSWGASWGESGYIRLVRNINQCGLADAASYPIA